MYNFSLLLVGRNVYTFLLISPHQCQCQKHYFQQADGKGFGRNLNHLPQQIDRRCTDLLEYFHFYTGYGPEGGGGRVQVGYMTVLREKQCSK